MVKIPTAEPSVNFQPTNQPTISGDAYASVGRAQSKFGDAIAGFGDAVGSMMGKLGQEDEYEDKLKVLQFQNNWEQDQIRSQNEFSRDDPNGYATERYGEYRGGVADLIPTLRSPKMQKWAGLHLEQHGSNVYERDLRFEYGKREEALVDRTRQAIIGQFATTDLDNPDTVDQALDGVMAGVDATVRSLPVKKFHKEIMNEAVGLAMKRLEEVYTKADRLDELPTAARKLIERMGAPQQQQAPVGVGPQSGLSSGSAMDVAKQFLGRHEGQDTEALASFFRKAGGQNLNPADTAWCAAFVNATLGATGQKGTGSLLARDFLKIGTAVDKPSDGDIVVLSRGDRNGWQGHVGFYAGRDANGNVLVLGGNQGNKVSVAPYSADRVLGFRRPPKAGSEVAGLSMGGAAQSGAGTTTVDKSGIELIKNLEGAKDQGWDYKQFSGPYGVKRAEGETLTPAQAEGRMKEEIGKVESDLAGKIKVPLTQGQHNALVSFFYNLGPGKGRLDDVADMINNGRAADVPAYMASKTKAGGKHLEGLANRRKAEIDMFNSGGQQKMALGGPDMPEKQRFALAGMSPEDKAKKLEEIVGQGYGKISHQLDRDGNDVLVAYKDAKPSWWRNAPSRNPEVKSELDNPEFAGPEWAHGSIKKIRSGELRPANTMPGGTQVAQAQAQTQVADASGRMPGVAKPHLAPLAEGLMKHMPEIERKAAAAEKKWLAGTEKNIKDLSDVIDRGYEPEQADLDALEERIMQKPKISEAYGLHAYVASLYTSLEASRRMRQLTPQQLAQELAKIDGEIAVNGTDKMKLAVRDHVEKILKGMREGVDKSALEYAEKAHIPVPIAAPSAVIKNEMGFPLRREPIVGAQDTAAFTSNSAAVSVPREPIVLDRLTFDGQDGDIDTKLARRAEQSRSVADYFQIPMQAFTPVERDKLKDVMRIGGVEMLSTIGRIYKAFGDDTPEVMKEFVKDVPEAFMLAKGMADGMSPGLLQDVAKAMHLRTAEADKFKSTIDRKQVDADMKGIIPLLARTPGLVDPMREFVGRAYEFRHRANGKTEFDPDLWRSTLQEALGERQNKEGVKFGGVATQGNWSWKSNSETVVHPNVRNDSFDVMINLVRDSDVEKIGSPRFTAPGTVGRTLTAKEIRAATWEYAGKPGKYVLNLGEIEGRRTYAVDTKGQPAVINVNPLIEDWRREKPEIFWK